MFYHLREKSVRFESEQIGHLAREDDILHCNRQITFTSFHILTVITLCKDITFPLITKFKIKIKN